MGWLLVWRRIPSRPLHLSRKPERFPSPVSTCRSGLRTNFSDDVQPVDLPTEPGRCFACITGDLGGFWWRTHLESYRNMPLTSRHGRKTKGSPISTSPFHNRRRKNGKSRDRRNAGDSRHQPLFSDLQGTDKPAIASPSLIRATRESSLM